MAELKRANLLWHLIIRLLSSLHSRRANYNLPIAQPAVSGADVSVLKDLEAFFLQPFAQQPRQSPVVQATAAHRHLVNSSLFTRIGSCPDESFRHASMKPRGYSFLANASP